MSAIEKMEDAGKLDDLSNVKKLTGFTNYYRIKLGDYRLGFEKIDHETIRLLQFAHRKDIYNIFP
jgi:mRNA interferase RelE/StbE